MKFSVIILLLALGAPVRAVYEYSCKAKNGALMHFETTSMFNYPDEPLFSYTDEHGKNFTAIGEDIRVRDDGEYYRVTGPYDQDPNIARFVAIFTIVDEDSDDVPAQIKFKDGRGETVSILPFTCQYYGAD